MRAKHFTSHLATSLCASVLLVLGGAAVGCDDGASTPSGGEAPPSAGTQAAPTKAPAATGGYEELDSVPNAGTITGTVTYGGDQEAAPLDVTKDPEVCSHGGEPDGSLVVTDGKLANALIYLVDVPSGKSWGDEAPTIDNNECLFVPRVQVARHRSDLSIKNSDPLLHNTNLTLQEGGRTLANIALPREDQVVERSLRRAGLVEVKCDVHAWMHAFIWVSSHPYAAVTGADGTFTIDGVPPGDYEAKAWHEELGEQDLTVTVAADGSATLDVTFE